MVEGCVWCEGQMQYIVKVANKAYSVPLVIKNNWFANWP
jgi:hypothetical protein